MSLKQITPFVYLHFSPDQIIVLFTSIVCTSTDQMSLKAITSVVYLHFSLVVVQIRCNFKTDHIDCVPSFFNGADQMSLKQQHTCCLLFAVCWHQTRHTSLLAFFIFITGLLTLNRSHRFTHLFCFHHRSADTKQVTQVVANRTKLFHLFIPAQSTHKHSLIHFLRAPARILEKWVLSQQIPSWPSSQNSTVCCFFNPACIKH